MKLMYRIFSVILGFEVLQDAIGFGLFKVYVHHVMITV